MGYICSPDSNQRQAINIDTYLAAGLQTTEQEATQHDFYCLLNKHASMH
jgi:hypothetical protein